MREERCGSEGALYVEGLAFSSTHALSHDIVDVHRVRRIRPVTPVTLPPVNPRDNIARACDKTGLGR